MRSRITWVRAAGVFSLTSGGIVLPTGRNLGTTGGPAPSDGAEFAVGITFRASSDPSPAGDPLFSLLVTSLAALSVASRGSPAPDTVGYWQQEVRYVIDVRLDEATGSLSGAETITYINRSPDSLTEFYLHLYLNAFRPGSRWADRDSVEGRRRFNDLGDPEHAFERLRRGTIDGVAVSPEYPYAPDSTVVRFALPRRLAPGDSMEVALEWDARPSTTPRRQGRRGRRFDFAQWYPRVVAYDRDGWQAHPLYPAGEFYGEFASYDVMFDLLDDQVIAATGVPLEGDPGWERAKGDSDLQIDYQADWYRTSPASSVSRCDTVEGGRKCVRFYAEDVHHFAWSVNPEYIYEEGGINDIVVRVLYLPGEEGTWGNGVAVGRTEEALRWLDGVFGPYPWPQLTNLHRIEGGGTEFPMVIMDGSASLGLILHESAHQYAMGILANNEWKQGFLDEASRVSWCRGTAKTPRRTVTRFRPSPRRCCSWTSTDGRNRSIRRGRTFETLIPTAR